MNAHEYVGHPKLINGKTYISALCVVGGEVKAVAVATYDGDESKKKYFAPLLETMKENGTPATEAIIFQDGEILEVWRSGEWLKNAPPD